MKRNYKKADFPVSDARRFLEPGPIALVSSSFDGCDNIMTMGWHTVMEFGPSLIGCMITAANHSFEMIRKSGECVINVPTFDYLDEIVGIGNCSGRDTDKFGKFKLSKAKATKVKAPLIEQCYANFECKVHDAKLLDDYNFFILEVVKAHVATYPKFPKTVHYRGDGIFMVSGKHVDKSKGFKPEML
jgi:flavin reductase (DIM6/NTAB) family NADH-FMN oxidoreductase RutF